MTGFRAFLVAWMLATIMAGVPVRAGAQVNDSYELLPTGEIPKDYSSWSLFLICDPAWVVQNGDSGIAELFSRYKAFGDAIDRDNLALWFWKEPAPVPSAALTDTGRSGHYCQKFSILPSSTPAVLLTTTYPDDPLIGDHYVIRLNGLNAEDSAEALGKLNDQLLVTGLNQAGLNRHRWWQLVLASTGAALSKTGCYFNVVSFSFKTAVLNAEIGHSAEASAC